MENKCPSQTYMQTLPFTTKPPHAQSVEPLAALRQTVQQGVHEGSLQVEVPSAQFTLSYVPVRLPLGWEANNNQYQMCLKKTSPGPSPRAPTDDDVYIA